MPTTRLVLWLARAAWAAQPVLTGSLLAAGLDGASAPVQAVAAVGCWAGWAVVLVALGVPSTVGLTAARLLAPGGVAAAVAAALAAPASTSAVVLAAGLAGALVAAVLVFTPEVGAASVQGSAYGAEVRLALRAPALVAAGVLPLVWCAFAAGVATGPLALAAGAWVPGVAGVLVGAPVAVQAARGAHGLARRWLVLVPAGLVLHDPSTLAEPVLVQRARLDAIGLARRGTDAVDLTAGAAGLAVEVRLSAPLPAAVRRGRRAVEQVTLERVLVAPTRPGAALARMAAHGLPVRDAPG